MEHPVKHLFNNLTNAHKEEIIIGNFKTKVGNQNYNSSTVGEYTFNEQMK